jgi:hypothetical protein
MRQRFAAFLVLSAACAGTPSHAALWSSTNEVVRRGQYTTTTVSLTGDGLVVGAQVDIALPPGVVLVSATGRNGGQCVSIPKAFAARVLWIDAALVPLPAVETPMCDLRLRVTSTASALWLTMQNAECVDALGTSHPCALDRGYLTITP